MSTISPQQAVKALVKAKWSEARIAKAVGTSQPTIHRLKHGTQKRVAFDIGMKLVAIASDFDDGAVDDDAREGAA